MRRNEAPGALRGAPQQYAAPAQYAAPQYAAPHSQQFTLPADAVPGKSYSFQTPDGRTMTFQVPQGYGPGRPIAVDY